MVLIGTLLILCAAAAWLLVEDDHQAQILGLAVFVGTVGSLLIVLGLYSNASTIITEENRSSAVYIEGSGCTINMEAESSDEQMLDDFLWCHNSHHQWLNK